MLTGSMPHLSASPQRLLLLYGGSSAEREVSLNSGRDVMAALRFAGHRVTPLDPGPDSLTDRQFLRLTDWSRFDLAVIMLHGNFGEDGSVQRLLDKVGLPYTGSSAAASRLAFSKSAAKERFRTFGIPTPPAVLLHAQDGIDKVEFCANQFNGPFVVKPDAQGSSLGVSVVRTEAERWVAVNNSFRYGSAILLEKYIAGEEWTVGFVGAEPLPALKVSTPRPFLDYDAKYQDDQTSVQFGDECDERRGNRVVEVASAARAAVGTSGICRVDLRVDSSGQPWVLEVNTLPGFTSHSAVPTAASRAGLSFPALCDRLVDIALRGRQNSGSCVPAAA